MPIEATETFRVLRMDEPMYGCEELSEDAPCSARCCWRGRAAAG